MSVQIKMFESVDVFNSMLLKSIGARGTLPVSCFQFLLKHQTNAVLDSTA
jgi:hypothetical protein